jgi:RNA polymerase sigma factor for flagellar operon FliA
MTIPAPPLDEVIDHQRELRTVMKRMARLNSRERQVINWYFFDGLKLREIAVKLGVTEPRACQIKTKAVEKLAAHTSTTGLIP